MRPKVVGLLVLLAVLAGGAVLVDWFGHPVGKPTFTCSLSDGRVCRDTEYSITSSPEFVFSEPRPGRLAAVDIRPAPPEWASSRDPGFKDADWGASLEREDGVTILAACNYSSDSMVACDTVEEPFSPPTN